MSDRAPHRARKRFGQNFLVDQNTINRIIRAIDPKPGEYIAEIGPGQAALTLPLIDSGAELSAVEIDRDLAAELSRRFSTRDNFSLQNVDALECDFSSLVPVGQSLRIIGNLPYNISTPLVFHLLSFRHVIEDMVFMLQSEVVDRIVAEPGSKSYGRLSVMVQYHCEAERLLSVPPGAFRPVPRVESAIVSLQPKPSAPTPDEAESMAVVVRAAFSARRKTLRNTLRDVLTAEQIESQGIDPARRAESVSLAEFEALAGLYLGGIHDRE